MKKKILVITAIILAAIFSATAVFAADLKLSPALDIISAECSMVKSTPKGNFVCFSEIDFELAMGKKVPSITICSLPDETDGVLTIGGSPVTLGQTISSVNFELLTFYPSEEITEASFKFSAEGAYTTECLIRLTDGINSAPVSSSVALTTLTDITCYGTMRAQDSDGDKLFYEITSYPSMGIISVSDPSTGNFSYTPYDGVTGYDCFAYRVRDEFGNYSDVCEVSLEISERLSKDVYADMEEHWAYCAALTMVNNGAMDVIYENGILYFDPDETVTRAEYLKTAMKALGAGNLMPAKTIFADDEAIGDDYSGYVSAAYKLGIIKGDETEIGLMFHPSSAITKSEAAVILNRILGCKTSDDTNFFDSYDIPAWAKNDISALSSLGIINGYDGAFEPFGYVTRAQTAQMLYISKKLFS